MPVGSLDDGTKLEAAWQETLNTSLTYFKALLASASSSSWKPVQVLPLTASTTARDSGQSSIKGSSVGRISASDVAVHRRKGKTGEVYRAVVEVECGSDIGVDTFRGCLATPETRPLWDRMVEDASTLDLLDAHTRVTKTNYRLGWPASPRDTITITRTLVDQSTLIDIATSLPRSRDEPPYLRPSPPHVRADVSLLAWCIQLPGQGSEVGPGRVRITCMWCWDPKGSWAVGGGVPQHLPSVAVGLVDYIRDGSDKIPVLRSYGTDITIGSINYDTSRITLSVGYAVLAGQGGRQLEFGVSSTQAWDVQIKSKSQNGAETASTAWTSFVRQMVAASLGQAAPKRLVLRFNHAPLGPEEEMVRVSVSIERTSAVSGGVRINGIPITIEPMGRPVMKRPILDDVASGSAISLRTISTVDAMTVNGDHKLESGRSQAADKSIAGLIKRNYIYFTSLLQEPEPKWRPVLDSRGVAVHQLNSIDKTLVVFRAEAVLVGVGIWDLFSVICNPGSRIVWDRSHEEATLLEDVNELTDLWYNRSKAAWPVAPRDSVMLRTIYKSPNSVHIFGFSTDDTDLFPKIPPSIDPTVIRTQIDLQGWSIESLSPNTTQVTLLEQSDPRGWSNKSSIPQVMMSTLAGMGDFAIKHGAPPVATRLGGAKALASRYDLEKETFRFEYDAAEERRSGSSSTSTAFPLPVAVRDPKDTSSLKSLDVRKPLSNIECEIRCDADKWANNFVIVVDPPPANVSALKRHRLSPSGGGLWLTIEHDPVSLGTEKVSITIRRGSSVVGTKTSLTINGLKTKIDLSDLSEADVQLLKKQKRGRPSRAPLDQPAALGTLRKKQSKSEFSGASNADPYKTITPSNYTRFALPLARMYNVAAETTRSAIIPMAIPAPTAATGATPVDAAIRALAQLSRMHADRESESTDPFGWQPVSDKEGLKIEKRIVSHVSDTFPVYRAGRIIEGFTAEEVSAAVSSPRKDERFEKPVTLQTYGHGIIASQITALTTFPFRPRNLLVATIVARAPDGPPPSPSVTSHPALSTIFHASSSSFDTATIDFESAKYNPATNTAGKVILEGWIIETIDPYSHEQYAIPSTRCMYVGAIDYSGNMPLSVNNMLNASLPRSILMLEQSLKYLGAPTRPRLPPMVVSVPEASAQGPWSLDGVDTVRVGVDQRLDSGEYSMTVTLQTTGPQKNGDKLSPGLRHNDSRSSFHSGRSTVVDLGEEIRRGKQDLVVCEVDIGTGMVRSGCEVMIRAVSLPAAQNTAQDGLLPLRLPSQDIDLPFKCCVIALSPSVLQSASLDPATQTRHLLRVTLPTSGYETQIADPLTGKGNTGPLPRPRWLLDLINDGAALELRMKPKLVGARTYTFAGSELAVEDERKVKVSSRIQIPQLANRETPGSISLDKPLAVAREFMSLQPPIIRPETRNSVSSEVPSQAEAVNGDLTEAKPDLPDPAPPRYKYNFWKYSRLGPFSAPVSVAASPVKATITTLAPETDQATASADPSPKPLRPLDVILQPVIPLPAFIIACLVCLLLGSLLRSLLIEADFVIYLPAGVEMPPGTSWRELRRIGQWRIWPSKDLVLAVARRAA